MMITVVAAVLVVVISVGCPDLHAFVTHGHKNLVVLTIGSDGVSGVGWSHHQVADLQGLNQVERAQGSHQRNADPIGAAAEVDAVVSAVKPDLVAADRGCHRVHNRAGVDVQYIAAAVIKRWPGVRTNPAGPHEVGKIRVIVGCIGSGVTGSISSTSPLGLATVEGIAR